MRSLGLKPIVSAVHHANAWVNEVVNRTDWGNKQHPYRLGSHSI
ncbi:hypothetical protein [Sagittula salina]|nr:hypothetical protein [Sagittula salina]